MDHVIFLIVIGHGCKRLDGCDLAVFVLGVMCHLVACQCLCIQGAWTEQWFPLSRFEVPGFWSYRLAASSSDKCGLGAEVEGTGWRAIGSSGTSRPLTFTLF
ncbi:hypothetical protein HID58_016023 [Brassica napus]|uniref:Secreted protein n=1 Tax=Brassica napus TaxID=3708 RepID=A0ABQ8DLT1_BRANA|nr:hypothetical protein HID58_016023 [Brassica napus]